MINAFFIGRLGADSEIKTSKNGNQFLSMRVACNEYSNGETTTTWINVIWAGERAVKLSQHMKKGSLITGNGTLRTSAYTNKNGETEVGVSILADRVDFVSVGKSGQTQSSDAVMESTGTLKKQDVSVAETPAVAEVPASASFVDDLPF